MTFQDFLSALETAVRKDDRWAIRQLESDNKESKLRREACRHADNLILAEKSGSLEIASYSRANLLSVIKHIQIVKNENFSEGTNHVGERN